MKIEILVIGKTKSEYLRRGIDEYLKRLNHYIQCRVVELPETKTSVATTEAMQKVNEGKQFLDYFETSDMIVLLDERGKQHSSREFALYIQKQMLSGTKRVFFVVGGPYGFSDEVYARAQGRISLSRMTFPHDLVRLIFVEQLYRSMTILRNEPYHHD